MKRASPWTIWRKSQNSCCRRAKPTNGTFVCWWPCSNYLRKAEVPWQPLTYFALWSVRLAGFLPDLRVRPESGE